MVWSACPVCGEFPKPLENWVPVEEEQPDGSIRVYGTPVYCACNRPKQ